MNQNLVVVLAIGLAGCALPPLPDPLSYLSMDVAPRPPVPDLIPAEMARPWYHVEGPVSDAKFEQDKDKCASTARQTAAGAGTLETQFLGVFMKCMRAQGYAPTPAEYERDEARIDELR